MSKLPVRSVHSAQHTQEAWRTPGPKSPGMVPQENSLGPWLYSEVQRVASPGCRSVGGSFVKIASAVTFPSLQGSALWREATAD